MIIINKPEQLLEVQCYKCKSIFSVHPMVSMNAPCITDCSRHKSHVTPCQHESDGENYDTTPTFPPDGKPIVRVQFKCIKCGEFYR